MADLYSKKMRQLEVDLKDTKYRIVYFSINIIDLCSFSFREKLSVYETVWHGANELMNCAKCGAALPFGQHSTEHNEKIADIIT